ncbi:MAG: hypothetical protein JJU25_08105 [Halomonas sp.]|nr:hypothetical protein [Halomonas sp.]MCC5882582.1 hypothetical protein [Halomonas sp.]
MNAAPSRAKLMALIGLALLLFSPPLVLIFDRPESGLSWLPLYLFVVWLLVIGLTAWLMEHRREEN